MSKVYAIVRDKILDMLDQGTVPWQQTWKTTSGMPRNFVSGKQYRGVNVFMLALAGYACPFWITKRQLEERGGRIKEGQWAKSTLVVFWTRFKPKNPRKGDEGKEIPCLRYYKVWNLLQTEGFDVTWGKEPREVEPIEACDKVVQGYTDPPEIEHGYEGAFYRPMKDMICMPQKAAFTGDAEYYSTLFHEMVHSTGHASRLSREGITEVDQGDKHKYSTEELIAEMGAAMLCGEAGIDGQTIENSAAYIKHWRDKIAQDSRLVVSAAAKAQKACDRILGRTWDKEKSE